MPTAHLEIKGKVQGVFFRATAKKIAGKYDLTGWVKNTNDGSVEAIVTGKKEDIEQFIAWCKQGPENAEVAGVKITYMDETFYDNFIVKR